MKRSFSRNKSPSTPITIPCSQAKNNKKTSAGSSANALHHATPENDELREWYGINENKMSSAWKEVLSDSEFKVDSLESLLGMEEEIMDYGGLDFWLSFPLLLNAIAEVYIKLGDHTKAGQYKENLARYHPTI